MKYRDDIVPRLCRYNLENLAKEVCNFDCDCHYFYCCCYYYYL